ncbi:hypothetical protein AUEXF2481DRAFT_231861 [Aureobasidium subglaciale EXF-2481]|uniref:Cryptic loci regulator 2 N-terminal domain-containing protein n=1 Tax=Aureobasidium subglaciale (strain EXF-2481) TaxID=1043005 RepID=A0A074Z831_AURSE|nr:uncharacterized protein AUEXF2481DRAFT_231861 [Aureobasidium subglaciale EXF-2481]KAI5211613.1 hypothetical protein E4T38_01183 [Aureobasidium subglaciale]KAI5230283.1 hypothetical protein E4T40_01184 [Aureobasidium subglaciale]KAI5233649.1 hypothetical protein E4T41_01182 [Aureobasidium subglaciale]KAI5267001.1 hypothetical protein E4T46_01182 [Aureobasidium subglaciale]KEQ95021.1 hypothetical protein AUEXF2481DRAFT_231861 [Aureobasidium subglaciale EXF-2481]
MVHVLFRNKRVAVRDIDLSQITSLESDPQHRPSAKSKYIPVPDSVFLELLTSSFNNHETAGSMVAELNCDRVRFVGGLPPGFACYEAPPKDGRHDRYIYGHHESTRNSFHADKLFRSFSSFVPHVYWIICDQVVIGNLPRGCKCFHCVAQRTPAPVNA